MQTLIVTAIGSFSASAVIRSCRACGFRVVGTEIHDPEDIAESADVDRFVKVPRFDAGDAYLAALSEIAREERALAILPLTDAELDLLNLHRALFRPAELWVSPEEAVRAARNKETSRAAAARAFAAGGRAVGHASGGETVLCPDRGLAAGGEAACLPDLSAHFSVIPTERVGDLGEEALLQRLPLILKPFDGRSSEGLFRVRTPRELSGALRAIREEGRETSYLVQPLLEGLVVCVDTVRGRDGTCISVPREEHRRTFNGAGLSVRVFRDPLLEAACAGIARELGILGCVNFEFIRTEDGRYHFLECNPRFSGGTGFSAAAGCDVVKLHLEVFTGKSLPRENPAAGCFAAKKYIEVVTKAC